MTKDELETIVDRVAVNWNQYQDQVQRRGAYKVWFHFLERFDYKTVSRYIDELAMTAQWPPRPGDVAGELLWRETGVAPPPKIAWNIYQETRDNLERGVDPGDIDPVIAKAMREMQYVKPDRQVFYAFYDDARGQYLMDVIENG